MIELNIPGCGTVRLLHLVSDVNGTLAVDGHLIEGVPRAIQSMRDRLEIHLLTADTHGRQAVIDQRLNLVATRIQTGDEAAQKAAYVDRLGAANVVAIGQGANDAAMLQAAVIGIGVMSQEGVSVDALHAADLLVPNFLDALALLENPLRLVASLRK